MSGGRRCWVGTTGFEKAQIVEQTNFYDQAVLGVDFCVGSLNFGEDWSRTLSHTVSKDLETVAASWYKDKDKQQFHFAVEAHHYKGSDSRDVKISVEFRTRN